MIRQGRGRPRKIRVAEPISTLQYSNLVQPVEKRPLFFKIIHPKIIQDRQLEIPMTFVRKFGDELSDVAVLKLPRGPEWHIRIKRDGHVITFHNRWEEFVNYHSISAGHFLLFRYDGRSQFYVLIFDMTGGEIDYRSDKIEEPSNDDDDRGGFLVAVKQEIIEENEEYIGNFGLTSPSGYESAPIGQTEVLTGSEMLVTEPCFKSRNHVKWMDPSIPAEIDAGAFLAACEFKSEHPFFIVPMKPSYVNHRYVPIPSTFDRSLLPKRFATVKIQGTSGQSWEARCLYSKNNKVLRLSKGISAFYGDNNIVGGDVCVFELIYKGDACAIELRDDISAMLIAHVFHRQAELLPAALMDQASSIHQR